MQQLGIAYADLGDMHKAIEFYERRLVIAQEIKDKHSEANALGNLGNAYFNLRELSKSITFFEGGTSNCPRDR